MRVIVNGILLAMSDKDIVTGILSGKEPVLRLFYKQHVSYVSNFVRQRMSDEKDVEEIVQDTLIATIEALRDFSFTCSLSTFMCSIAKRKIIDTYRRRKLHRIVFSQFARLDQVLAVFITPEERLNEVFVHHAIDKAFACIAPWYREILKLKYIEGLSVREIALKHPQSIKSIESALFRARKAFAKAYVVSA